MPRTARSTRHSRKNLSDRKGKVTGAWFAICGILLALIVAGIFLILNPPGNSAEPQSADSSAQQNAPQNPAQNPAEQDPAASGSEDSAAGEAANASAADRVAAIAALAKQGKIEGLDFTVGLTREQEVESQWQAPKQTSQSSGSVYADYPAQDATIGYKNGIVVDLRSDRDDLQEIRYRDIVDKLGDADSVKSYRDNDVDQAILGYHLPNGYTLRWVLSGPLPTTGASAAAGSGLDSGSDRTDENGDNPPLDHLSLIGPVRTESAQADNSGSAAGQTSPDSPASIPSASPQTPAAPAKPGSEVSPPNGAATDLLAGMTLDQKIGQMVIAGLEGTSLREADRALIRDYGVGGVIFYADNTRSAAQTQQFTAEVRAANPRGALPLFVSVDQEGGRVARLKGVDKVPTASAIGAKNDPAYARSIGEQLGEQLRSQGFNLDYAPVLDVNSNPDNPVIGDRSFGSDANQVSKIALPVMEGLESKKIIPVVKHFPGHGDTSVDSHIALPVVNKSLAQLEKLELIPFKKAIADGADVVMIAHILLPKLDEKYPSSMSKAVITDLLRGKLGFEGVVMTDDMTMGAIAENYGLSDAAVRSVQAGSDIVLVAHGANNAIDTIQAIKKAVEAGKISEQRINESAARIVALKQKYLSVK